MKNGFISRFGTFLTSRGEHRKRAAVFAGMAAVVLLGTGAALKLYGRALTHQEQVLDCRLEVHEHEKACEDEDGNYICGYADYVVHVHNSDCYSDGNLVCTIPEREEHRHEQDCYEEVKVLDCEKTVDEIAASEGGAASGRELVCPLSEHVHTDACFSDGYICGKEEHVHSSACETKTLICDISGHEHGEGCYSREITCGKEEHVHGEGCKSDVPSCGMTEHKHGDSCYQEKEAAPGTTPHVHTEDCYKTVKKLVCGELELHKHDDSCFDEDGRLICGEIELVEHRHTVEDGCLRIVELEPEAVKHDHTDECCQNGKLVCGVPGEDRPQDHVHGAACYNYDGEFICWAPSSGTHVHSELCYDELDRLCCGYEGEEPAAHEHDDSCYDDEGRLICGYEADEHVHTDACRDKNGKLVCEAARNHTHTSECYNADGKPVCGYGEIVEKPHEHDMRCYDIRGNLQCAFTDAGDHEHTEACYDRFGQVTCGYQLHEYGKGSKSARVGDASILVEYDADAEIPEEAVFYAENVTDEEDLEPLFFELADEVLEERRIETYRENGDDSTYDEIDPALSGLVRFGFYVEEDGERIEIEPKAPVNVVIRTSDDSIPDGSTPVIARFEDDRPVKAEGQAVRAGMFTFETDDSGVFGFGYIPEEKQREISRGSGILSVLLDDKFNCEKGRFRFRITVEGQVKVEDDGSHDGLFESVKPGVSEDNKQETKPAGFEKGGEGAVSGGEAAAGSGVGTETETKAGTGTGTETGTDAGED